MSGRTETGGGELVIVDGRGAALTDGTLGATGRSLSEPAALTDGTLGATLGATGRWLSEPPALAGATLEDFDGGAALGVASRVVSGVFGAGATLGAGRVETGGLGIDATPGVERTLGGADCELAFPPTARAFADAGVMLAAAGFAFDG